MDRSLAFYRDLLGFPALVDSMIPLGVKSFERVTGLMGASAKVAFLDLGNALLEIFQYLTPEGRMPEKDRPANYCGITHLCIDVDDVEAVYKRLLAAGVRFHCEPTVIAGMAYTTYARDPDDNIVEFQQLLPRGELLRLRPTGERD